MWIRIATALVLAPLVVALTLMLPTLWFGVVLMVVILLGLFEWHRLTVNSLPAYLLSAVVIVIMACWLFFRPQYLPVFSTLVTVFWAIQCYRLLVDKTDPWAIFDYPVYLFLSGIICLLGAWVGLIALHAKIDHGPWMALAVLFMVWAADSFAYFVGKYLGKRKLAPRISPNKTIEGVIGGMVGTALVAGISGLLLGLSNYAMLVWVIAGICAGIFSVVGDLYESSLKRNAGVKDSGDLLPGHGGVLDRIDGLIAASPVFLTILYWVA